MSKWLSLVTYSGGGAWHECKQRRCFLYGFDAGHRVRAGWHPLPTHVPLTGKHIGLRQNSIVMLEQIRTIDRSRLRAYLGCIGGECLRNVDEALGVSLGLFIRETESKEE